VRGRHVLIGIIKTISEGAMQSIIGNSSFQQGHERSGERESPAYLELNLQRGSSSHVNTRIQVRRWMGSVRGVPDSARGSHLKWAHPSQRVPAGGCRGLQLFGDCFNPFPHFVFYTVSLLCFVSRTSVVRLSLYYTQIPNPRLFSLRICALLAHAVD
jgi:hypothetical protein